MACCHKVLLLVDTAGDAARHSPARRAALRLLTYLSCRFGLARVHWAFKFFDSQGARSRPSRVSDFRELGSRSWEDFEEELEARLGDRAPGAHLPGPTPRATHTLSVGSAGDHVAHEADPAEQRPETAGRRQRGPGGPGRARGLWERRLPPGALSTLAEGAAAVRVRLRGPGPTRAANPQAGDGEGAAQEGPGGHDRPKYNLVLGGHHRAVQGKARAVSDPGLDPARTWQAL
ncbi:Ticrr [Lemmus lemmus]